MRIISAVSILGPFVAAVLVCGNTYFSRHHIAFAEFEGTQVSDQKLSELLQAAHSGTIMFTGLKVLTDAQAERLGRFDGWNIYLSGLEELSPRQARLLARFQGGHLKLDGLKELRPEVAGELRACRCGALTLNGLRRISVEALEALQGLATYHLMLLGLDSLSAEEAQVLAQNRVMAVRLGLQSLSPEAARQLAEARTFWLTIERLSDPTVAVLEALSHLHERDQFMTWLDSLVVAPAGLPPPNGKRILRRSLLRLFPMESLHLNDVVSLTPQQVSALAGYPGVLTMPKLDSASMELLRAEREKRNVSAPIGANGIPARAPDR